MFYIIGKSVIMSPRHLDWDNSQDVLQHIEGRVISENWKGFKG